MPLASEYTSSLADNLTTSIASGATESAAINFQGCTLCGIFLPAAFTGTSLSFSAAASEGGSFLPLQQSDGTLLTVPVTANRYLALDASLFMGVRFLRIISNASEAAGRTLVLAARSL